MTPGSPIGLLLLLTYSIAVAPQSIPVIIDSAGNSASINEGTSSFVINEDSSTNVINESSNALIIDEDSNADIIDDRVTIE